ncbi:MAG: cytoplasmic protein [Helicobacteraceae bacterium]|jgi:alpha-tubulin suppressor-like RCC1 family protein|nr:cytoplasmic protein [Helicobacteraceae bacterium]
MAAKMQAARLQKAHQESFANKAALAAQSKCGCFHCLKVFKPSEIVEWIEEKSGQTAVCPYCGIDSVIGESAEREITADFLRQMNEYWFSGV